MHDSYNNKRWYAKKIENERQEASNRQKEVL